MNLKHLTDSQLLLDVKTLVNKERQILTQVLHHLREVERRKLFSSLGYKSLFEYALKELGYSEGQVCRRLQAMRLIKEIPEVEKKISAGALSLNNISKASSFFKEAKRQDQVVNKAQVLQSLENKSSKEGERVLLSLLPSKPLPKEKAMVVGPKHTELNFLADENLLDQLEEVRSLLGPKGASMSLAELVTYMCEKTSHQLKIKKFGKKRVEAESSVKKSVKKKLMKTETYKQTVGSTYKKQIDSSACTKCESKIYPHDRGKNLSKANQNPRLISPSLKHEIWLRDQGQCVGCGSKRHLQYDHIKPVAHGGLASIQNLRLLCFSCNQRKGVECNLVPMRE